jgi:SEC-C motif-containing protein
VQTALRDAAPCPCGQISVSHKKILATYAECCGRYIGHFDAVAAPDAECLMRSRYSAFVQSHATYLLDTWHSSMRPKELTLDEGVKWLGLEVRDHQRTGEGKAEVTFVARYRVAGKAVRLHERSRFLLEAGRWFYLNGDMLA